MFDFVIMALYRIISFLIFLILIFWFFHATMLIQSLIISYQFIAFYLINKHLINLMNCNFFFLKKKKKKKN